MPKPPSLPPLASLVDALRSPRADISESAVARLRLVGALAVPKLVDLARATDAPAAARARALRVLASVGGREAVQTGIACLEAADLEIVEEACVLLGDRVQRPDAEGARALDALTALAMSPAIAVDRRLLALAALDGLPDALLRPVHDALAQDPSSRIVSRVLRQRAGGAWSLEGIVERGLPPSPALAGAIAGDEAEDAPVTLLRKTIDLVRTRESQAGPDEQLGWRSVRATLHDALARRHSRIALYDLRETLESATGPVPIGFLAAAAAIADVTCLEAVGYAWMSAAVGDQWYRDHLRDVFTAIVHRERITRDHKTLTKMLTRHPGTAPLVAIAPRKTVRRVRA